MSDIDLSNLTEEGLSDILEEMEYSLMLRRMLCKAWRHYYQEDNIPETIFSIAKINEYMNKLRTLRNVDFPQRVIRHLSKEILERTK